MTWSGRQLGLLRALAILVAALVLAWPALQDPTGTVLGSPRTDTVKHLWTLFLGRTMLLEQGALWGHTDLASFPEGMDIFVIEPLGAVVAALLGFVPVVLVANLLAVANLVLLGLATAWLGDHLAGGRLPGLVAALLMMGSSVTAFFFHLGVGELQHLFLLPLCLLLAARLAEWGRWSDAGWLGLCLGLTVACGFYLGLFAVVGVSLACLVALVVGPRRLVLLSRLGVAAPLSLAVAWPFLQGFRGAWPGTRDNMEQGFSLLTIRRPPTEEVWARLDLGRLLWPIGDSLGAKEADYIGGQYLGPILVGLALVGIWRGGRRALPLVGVALAGLLLAMGTHAVWLGEELAAAQALVLPYAWLQWLLSGLAAAPHYPSRFIALTAVALAALASLAVARLRRPPLQAAAVVVALLAAVDVGGRARPGFPWHSTELAPASVLSSLAAEDPGAVVDLGYFVVRDHDMRNRGAWYQVAHGLPTQAVAISRLDDLHRDGAARVIALPLVQDLRLVHATGGSLPEGRDYAVDLALLREDGFSWLMLYQGSPHDAPAGLGQQTAPPPHRLAALTSLLGPPRYQEEALAVWQLPPVDVDPDALEAGRRARDRALGDAWDDVFERAR